MHGVSHATVQLHASSMCRMLGALQELKYPMCAVPGRELLYSCSTFNMAQDTALQSHMCAARALQD